MKKEIYVEGLGNVLYDESVVTGKRKVYVNNHEADKVNKTLFSIKTQNPETSEEKTENIQIEGGIISGVSLKYNSQKYVVFAKTAWYEYLLAILSFVFDVIWGNSPDLCAIFPVVAGAIGGAICGVMVVVQILVMKKFENPLLKIAVSLALTIVTILLLFLTALMLLSLIK